MKPGEDGGCDPSTLFLWRRRRQKQKQRTSAAVKSMAKGSPTPIPIPSFCVRVRPAGAAAAAGAEVEVLEGAAMGIPIEPMVTVRMDVTTPDPEDASEVADTASVVVAALEASVAVGGSHAVLGPNCCTR